MKRTIELIITIILLGVFIYVGRDKLAAYYYNRGVDFFDRGKYSQAIDEFSRSLKINSKRAPTHYTLAATFVSNNNLDKAMQEYRKTIELDPGYVPAYRALAELYINQEKFDEGLELLNKAQDKSPNDVSIKELKERAVFEYSAKCLSEGVDAFLVNDKARAYELVQQGAKIKPDFAYAYYTLGSFYHADKKPMPAVAALEQAVSLDPKLWLAYKMLGDIYFEQKKYRDAVENYKKAVKINNRDAGLQNNLGLALMEEESYSEAIVYLQEALKLEPDNVNLRYSLASVYRDRKDPKSAIKEYRKIIKVAPDYPNIHNDLGDIFTAAGNDIEAEYEYQQEIENDRRKLKDDPENPLLLYALARANFGIKEYESAKEAIGGAIAKNSDNRDFYLLLGQIEKKLGNFEASLEAMNKSKELSPGVKFIDKDIADLKKNFPVSSEGK
ncbi:MAG: tetratricopeptide repeat protein [Candidatus Omnitrophica bacterium]|nr:tetratricopeptide repeat protein [Candidatus Omnitrophota bacterium]MDD5653615.1 tetratricopeptide repeat protein [Candidatus Omnitrophota bacterium]